MRTRIVIGLSLALGCVVVPGQAEEIQWRAAAPRVDKAAPAARVASGRGFSLSQPIPLPAAEPALRDPAMRDPGVTPVSFRPVPLVRARADEVRYPAPMPAGPSFPTATPTGEKLAKPEEIPAAPTPIATPGNGSAMVVPYGGEGTIVSNGPDGCACDDGCCCDCGCCHFWPFGCCLGGFFGNPAGPIGGFGFLDGCANRRYFWASAEYLIWSISHDHVVPLLATGEFATPDAVVAYGSDQLPNHSRSGGRFTAGFWLPFLEQWGGEVSYLFLGQRDTSFAAASTGSLVRPFINANTDLPQAVQGTFTANATSSLWGLEANARRKLFCGPGYWCDCLFGYRHLQLDESLDVIQVQRVENAKLFSDGFATQNDFNGFQTGMEAQWNFWRRWSVGGFWKVGVGNVTQVLNISGFSTGQPQTGFLVQGNNGTHTEDKIGILPEVGVKLAWNPTQHLQFFVGYDALFLNNVIRVGEQVDAVVGPYHPAVVFNTSSFWAQGVNFGMIYNW